MGRLKQDGKKFILTDLLSILLDIVGNKAKEPISKRALQENKTQEIFRKTNISYPLIGTRTCVYQVVRNIRFSENLACFFSCNTRFEIGPTALLPTILSNEK